jgi:hypothetical protein
MKCNLCGNETTESGNAFIALPFGVICDECNDDINEFGTSRILQDEPIKENN